MIELIPITDPNQLTLGIESQVLTTEQQERLQLNVATVNSQAERLANDLRSKRALLLDGGFTEDEFVFELKEDTEMRTFNLASWREPEVLVEAEVKYVSGGCTIKFNRFNERTGQIEEQLAHFSNEGRGKFSCSTLVNSYRAVKAETLKRKVIEKNQDAVMNKHGFDSVSYTHLTLPTKRIV